MKPPSKTNVPKVDTLTSELPPWPPSDEWTLAKLNQERDKERAIEDIFIEHGKFTSGLTTHTRLEGYHYGPAGPTLLPSPARALQIYTETGDITLLQRVAPKIAKRLPQIPGLPRKHGAPLKEQRGDPIWEAVRDARTIKRIWLEHFDKRDKDRAETIAKNKWKIKLERDIKTFERALREPKRARE
jgi:hypothetical protein